MLNTSLLRLRQRRRSVQVSTSAQCPILKCNDLSSGLRADLVLM
ncbi:hypothetical protein [Nostoc sp.]